MSFETLLRLIQEKDLVRAGTVNKPLRQVDQNVRYIWDVLQAAAIGSTVYARRQTVEVEAKQGMALWLNPATKRFERGLALAEVDQSTGVVATAPSAQVWGVVAAKINDTLADILLFGLDDVDVSQAVDGPVEPGVYYLSGTNPGKLTRQKPPVSVAVLRATPDGKVFVMPQFVDFLDRHTHYKFPLTCQPAGDTTPPAPGGRHVITNPDASLSGWLPADHPSFGGKAPPLAVFGYNLAAHPQLKNVWPPIPFDNCSLEWDKGLDPDVSATSVPLGPGGLVIADRHGIWWTSDCYGDVPWPVDFDNADRSASVSTGGYAECPRLLHMAMTLWFTRVNFATDATAVLSLHSKDNRIKVRCYGTDQPANSGHLELALDLDITVTDEQDGHLAIKEFDPETSEFKRGPVVEGLYAGSGNVKLTGTAKKTRKVDNVDREVHQGLVAVVVTPEDTLELDVQLVRLDGAEEEYYQDFMYLGFVQAEQREYRAKIQVPSDLSISSPKLKLRFLLLGRAQGTLPQLVFTGRLLPRPAAGSPAGLPSSGSEFTIACDTQKELSANNQYVEVESEEFVVTPGDTLFFTVKRLATDGYGAEVGVLRQQGVLIAGS